MDLLTAHLIMEPVRVDSRRIDDDFSLQLSLRCLQDKVRFSAVLGSFYLFHGSVEHELHTVRGSVLRISRRQGEGTYDTAGRRVQSPLSLIRNMGLHLLQFVPADDAQAWNTILFSLFQQPLQNRPVLIQAADDQRSDLFKRNIQVTAHLLHHPVAFHIQLRHQGAGLRVISRMDDRAVCLARSAADVLRALDHKHLQVIPAQFSCGSAAAHTCPDDYDIIHHIQPPPFSLRSAATSRSVSLTGSDCRRDPPSSETPPISSETQPSLY